MNVTVARARFDDAPRRGFGMSPGPVNRTKEQIMNRNFETEAGELRELSAAEVDSVVGAATILSIKAYGYGFTLTDSCLTLHFGPNESYGVCP
jgi:hypothetical protein